MAGSRLPGDVAADLSDPTRALGYFTFVAATDVLGTRLAADSHHTVAWVLLAIDWLAWLVFGYVIPWTAVPGQACPPCCSSPTGPGSSGSWRASRSRCHLAHRIPPRYEAARWNVVFPPTCAASAGTSSARPTTPIVKAIGAPTRAGSPPAAWALTFAVMLAHLFRTLLRPRFPATGMARTR